MKTELKSTTTTIHLVAQSSGGMIACLSNEGAASQAKVSDGPTHSESIGTLPEGTMRHPTLDGAQARIFVDVREEEERALRKQLQRLADN